MLTASATDKGIVRDHNEDFVEITTDVGPAGAVMVVADGLGGHAFGEVASRLAVKKACGAIRNGLSKSPDADEEKIERLVSDAFTKASCKVIAEKVKDAEKSDMATTLVVAVAIGDRLIAGNVGDSRLYRIRAGKIEQISVDHSFVEEEFRAGRITRQQAKHHPYRNIITRTVGSDPDVRADLFKEDFLAGDIYMACSDGLTNMMEDREILAAVLEAPAPQAACKALVDGANARGGLDNITVAILSKAPAFGER